MMSEATMVAELRTSFGKGAARKSRAAGRTPAVIYGHGSDPRHITLPARELALVLRHKNAVIDLLIDGKNESVLVKSATKDVVTQVIEHVDLVTIVKGEKVHVEVPVHVVGESLSGTTIDLEHKTVKLLTEANNIPEYVEAVFNKEGAGFHLLAKDIKLPAGVALDLPEDELIASVIATAAGQSEEPAVEAVAAAE
ncbi:MAG: 50S ribosomal protein L25/general stress protein Ctc [Actinobacteria bacterium]|nr:50S ribosomal protein L25/general stress protein Ctc [Actinomycetota bacterium]